MLFLFVYVLQIFGCLYLISSTTQYKQFALVCCTVVTQMCLAMLSLHNMQNMTVISIKKGSFLKCNAVYGHFNLKPPGKVEQLINVSR